MSCHCDVRPKAWHSSSAVLYCCWIRLDFFYRTTDNVCWWLLKIIGNGAGAGRPRTARMRWQHQACWASVVFNRGHIFSSLSQCFQYVVFCTMPRLPLGQCRCAACRPLRAAVHYSIPAPATEISPCVNLSMTHDLTWPWMTFKYHSGRIQQWK